MRDLLAILLTGWVLLLGRGAFADSIRTDANIVTGLDISGSIEALETQIQVAGMAMAIRSPEVIEAIQRGRHGRVGLAIFLWANGAYPVFSSWRLISSPEDALAAADEFSNHIDAILGSDTARRLGQLTDLSGAIEYGGGMLRAAPFATDRPILNILGNGIDNVGESPKWARDRLVAQGATINAVVIGHDRGVFSYFRTEVIGGPAAFVLSARNPEALVEVLERKFATEIANARQAGPAPGADQVARYPAASSQ